MTDWALMDTNLTTRIGVVTEVMLGADASTFTEGFRKNNERYIKDITGIDPAPLVGWFYAVDSNTWSETDIGFEANRRTMTPIEFWNGKFTDAELEDIREVLLDRTPAGVTITPLNRSRLWWLWHLSMTAGAPIGLAVPKVVQVVDGLESSGILAAGRANQILER